MAHGRGHGGDHSQVPIPWFLNVPGLKLVAPSTPYDAKGLLKAAIRDDNPVMFVESQLLYGTKGVVPEEEYTVPLGTADVKRTGADLTVVCWGPAVIDALQAAEALDDEDGLSVEVVDIRSLVPLDREHVIASVKKTGRLIVIDEDYHSFGVSGEIIASVVEHDIGMLKARPQRVAFPDIPIPFTPVMEQWALPNADKIVAAYHAMHKE